MRRKLPAAFYNRTSIFGMTIFATCLAMIVFLFALDTYAGGQNAYMGLIIYIAVPMVMLVGLVIAFIGLFAEIKRRRRGLEEKPLPVIDFNKKRHYNAFTMFLIGGSGLLFLSGFGTYQAYEYTESVEFCGEVCHDVMKPEYVAYHNSPHAKVKCAECHIGGGADWYVKSKLSGARQVLAVMRGNFARPIETPVANLRPARETCEKCHWPDHFYAQKLKDRTFFLQDEENSKHQISMLMKIGGTRQGESHGIHAHMYLDQEVYYVATDRQRQEIPYVEMRGKDGKVTIYRDPEAKFNDADLPKFEKRIVDCIDCHNRPSHRYPHPEFSVNTAMLQGQIDTTIPEIKMVAVEALNAEYKTESEALAKIKESVEKYYKENHTDRSAEITPKLPKAITAIQGIYKVGFFPEMKASWKSYPDNLDHLHNKGCFRCHNDRLKSADGRVIKSDCQTCHTIISQMGPDGKRTTNMAGEVFRHPGGEGWEGADCKSCHGNQDEAEE